MHFRILKMIVAGGFLTTL